MSPNYKWECENCDHTEISNYSIAKVPKIRTCSQCGEHALYRLIGTGSMFKLKTSTSYKQ